MQAVPVWPVTLQSELSLACAADVGQLNINLRTRRVKKVGAFWQSLRAFIFKTKTQSTGSPAHDLDSDAEQFRRSFALPLAGRFGPDFVVLTSGGGQDKKEWFELTVQVLENVRLHAQLRGPQGILFSGVLNKIK